MTIEHILIAISLLCNIYLFISHERHKWAVDKFNQMQMDINEAMGKAIENLAEAAKTKRQTVDVTDQYVIEKLKAFDIGLITADEAMVALKRFAERMKTPTQGASGGDGRTTKNDSEK